MSIELLHPSPAHSYSSMAARVEEADISAAAGRNSVLAGITDTAGFSLVAPRLKEVLDKMVEPKDNILETLADNISRLQDGFVDALYTLFKDADADTILAHKITLTLNDEGRLRVAGEHPHKEAVETLLEESPELSNAFLELASQSLALRHLSSLRTVVQGNTEIPGLFFPPDPAEAVYLISLKGDMNHFYFRPAAYGL